MTATATKFDERDPVREAVRRAVTSARGNLPDAARLLEMWVREDRDLFDLICSPFVPRACWDLLRAYVQQERKGIWAGESPQPDSHDPTQRGSRIHYLARSNFESLFDFRLPIGGMPKLGESTYQQVQEAIAFYHGHAEDMKRKGDWLALVLHALSPRSKKPVKDQVSLVQLQRLHKESTFS